MDWSTDPIEDLMAGGDDDLGFFFQDGPGDIEPIMEISISNLLDQGESRNMNIEEPGENTAVLQKETASSVEVQASKAKLTEKLASQSSKPHFILNELAEDHDDSEEMEKIHKTRCNRQQIAEFQDLIKSSSSRREPVAFDQASLRQAVKAYALADLLLKIKAKFDDSTAVVQFGKQALTLAHECDKKIAVEVGKSKKKKVPLSQAEGHGYIRFHRPEDEYKTRLNQMTSYIGHICQKKGFAMLDGIMKRINVTLKLVVQEIDIESQRFSTEQEGRRLELLTKTGEGDFELFLEAVYFNGPLIESIVSYTVLNLMAPKLYSTLRKEINQKHLNETSEFMKVVKVYGKTKNFPEHLEGNTTLRSSSRALPANLREVLQRKEDKPQLDFSSLFGLNTLNLIEQLEDLFLRYARINSVRLEEILRRPDFFYFEDGIKQLVYGMYRLLLEYIQRLKTHEIHVVRYRKDADTFRSCLLLESKLTARMSDVVDIEYPEFEMVLFSEGVHALSLVFEEHLEKISMKGLLRLLKESEYPSLSVLKKDGRPRGSLQNRAYNELVPQGFITHKAGERQPKSYTNNIQENCIQQISSKNPDRVREDLDRKKFQPSVKQDERPTQKYQDVRGRVEPKKTWENPLPEHSIKKDSKQVETKQHSTQFKVSHTDSGNDS